MQIEERETFIHFEDRRGICKHCNGTKEKIITNDSSHYWRYKDVKVKCKHKCLKADYTEDEATWGVV